MKRIYILSFLVAAVITSTVGAFGTDLPWGDDGAGGGEWYSFEPPASPEEISMEGAVGEAEGIWISDISGMERKTALEIPMGAWARVMMAPSGGGRSPALLPVPHGDGPPPHFGRCRGGPPL